MTVTVVKTIGSTGTFSTVQLWEDGAPANLTTAEQSAAGTFLVAAFTQGESLTFVGSGATGKFLDTDSTGVGTGTYVTYGVTTGNPAASDVVTGGSSGATCVLSSGTPIDTGIIWQGQCQNQTFTVAGIVLNMSGSTSSSACYKELTTVAGASFIDNANVQTNALRYNTANGAALSGSAAGQTVNMGENFCRINKLQIEGSNAGSGRAVSLGAATQAQITQCICEGNITGGSSGVVAGQGGCFYSNLLIVQRASAASFIMSCSVSGISTSPLNLYNVTMVCPDDIATAPTSIFTTPSTSGTIASENCAIFDGDSTKAIQVSSGATFTFTTCYSDISGTTGVTQTTYGNAFQDVNDATRDFRLKAGSALLDTGTTDATNAPVDIVNTTRPQGAAYDVGCWELVVPKGTYLDPLVFGGAL